MTDFSAAKQVRNVCDFARDDQRQSTRFRKEPGTDFAQFTPHGCEAVWAEVYDESLTGICLVLSDPHGFQIGTKVELVYRDTPLHGEVRHLTPQASGSVLVGFSCVSVGCDKAAATQWSAADGTPS